MSAAAGTDPPSAASGFSTALLTVFGLGLLRPASGTWGSLPPPVLAVLLAWLIGPGAWIDASLIALGLVFGFVCLRFGEAAERRFAGKDPSQVVADEVAGQCVTLLMLPWRDVAEPRAWEWNLALAGIAFVAFRLLDIVKPPPARGIQKLPAGWGILLDDLVAGIYALFATQVIVRFLLPQIMSPVV